MTKLKTTNYFLYFFFAEVILKNDLLGYFILETSLDRPAFSRFNSICVNSSVSPTCVTLASCFSERSISAKYENHIELFNVREHIFTSNKFRVWVLKKWILAITQKSLFFSYLILFLFK